MPDIPVDAGGGRSPGCRRARTCSPAPSPRTSRSAIRTPPPAAISRAARLAGAEAFIPALARGFDTRLSERALTLSAGQRQRIALARAFLRDAPLVLLDEPTAHLDPATASEIMATIDTLMAGRTVLLVSARAHTEQIPDVLGSTAAGASWPVSGRADRGADGRGASGRGGGRPCDPAVGPDDSSRGRAPPGREPLVRLLGSPGRCAASWRWPSPPAPPRRAAPSRCWRRRASCWPGRQSTRASSRSPARWSRSAPSASGAASSATASGSARTTSPSGCWPTCGWRFIVGSSGSHRRDCARSGPAISWPGSSVTSTPSRICSSAASRRR